ncbi:MAG TPA: SIS domain-containing protein [Terracidiphilus sp.]|nr:SIS domain-containing protein [Terracidiphilus sp.]
MPSKSISPASAQTVFQRALNDAVAVYANLGGLEPALERAAALCSRALLSGNKLLACGNGGSASDAQHLAGELVGRYKGDRRPWPAIALSADSAVLTCIGNDYGYEQVFARQVTGLGKPGDVLVVFSTSGRSPNVLRALEAARTAGLQSVAFLGRDGGPAAALTDVPLVVAHEATARIQEGHQFLLHALMDQIEASLPAKG